MTQRWLMMTALGLTAACGKGPASGFDGKTHGFEIERPAAAIRGVTPGSVTFRGELSGFFPATLSVAVPVQVTAGVEAKLALPISASASTAWVTVKANREAEVRSGGVTFAVAGSQTASVVLPINAAMLTFSSDVDVQLAVQLVGYFDQSGAGWVADAPSEPMVIQLPEGTAEVELPAAAGDDTDDTWARWVVVSGHNAAGNTTAVSVGACGVAQTESLLWTQDAATPMLLPRGKVCVGASAPNTEVKIQSVGRFRRFAKTGWRATEPLPVLDLLRRVGWAGVPAEGQVLDVSLKDLSALAGAEQVMLLVTSPGQASINKCGDIASGWLIDRGSRVITVGSNDSLCVSAAGVDDLRIEVVGAVFSGEVALTECPALPVAAACAATDLLGRLNCIPGVHAVVKAGDVYSLTVDQPADHARPDGELFKQRVELRYAGANAPVSLHTTGYELFSSDSDLAATFFTTEVEVEHRFFKTSTPASKDFSTMDIVQSAQDSHRIVELLRPVLGNHWVSTGHSKGGMTALFHRRFFPCDVDGSVPFVTPISYGLRDKRYGPFLQQIGGQKYAACRQVFRDIDHAIIADKARYTSQMEGTYSKMGSAENALWASVGMSSWNLFQYGADDPQQGCPAYVALRGSPPDWQALVDSSAEAGIWYSDEGLVQLGQQDPAYFGYIFQTVNELGTQGPSLEHLADLGPVPNIPEPTPFMLGSVPVPAFEPRAMRDVQEWVKAHGKRLLFVYGENDPWSGGAVELGNAQDSAKITIAEANHGARFEMMTQEDRAKAEEMVLRWFGPRQRLGGGEKVIRHITPKRFAHFMRERGI